jgi:hypothetical protein
LQGTLISYENSSRFNHGHASSGFRVCSSSSGLQAKRIKMKLVLSIAICTLMLSCATLPPADDFRKVQDKKDAICQFVNVWTVDNPELENVKKLCDADASLKEIAAEYAGCKVDD